MGFTRLQRQSSIVLLSLAVVLSGCGSGDRADRSIEWAVFKPAGPRSIKLVSEINYCLGAPIPKISRVTTAYSEHRVRIELFLAEPPGAYRTENCRGIIRPVYKTIWLKRNLNSVELFDASRNPPERRWPN